MNHRIRVLLLIPTLDQYGAEKQFSSLATKLPRDEFDVHAVALTRGGPYAAMLSEHRIPLTILHKRFKFDPVALWRLKRLIERLKPHILHSWLFTANAYGRLAVGPDPALRVIVSEQCVDEWKRSWHFRVDRRLMSRTHAWIANSQSVAQFYQERGTPAERLHVIANGIEHSNPSGFSSDARDAYLAQFDIPPGARIVGYVGRLARQKRVEVLILAAQLLKQMHHNVYLLVVGDGPERERLGRFSRKMSCDGNVRLIGHRGDILQVIGTLDVAWLASDFEGMSNSIMECMAAGVPVVASDISANRELIENGGTGFLVDSGDAAAFARCTHELLNQSQIADRIATAARERMRFFSVEKMVQGHADFYRGIVE